MRLIKALVGFIACALLCSAVSAQVYGDYDGDGDVDGDDFIAFGGCMTGPASGPLGAGCGVFDFNVNSGTDGFVDMADFWTMQRAAGADGGCTPGKKYAELVKEQTGVPITGVSAKIVTRSVTLCQEGVVAGNDGKSSNAHVTVLDPVNTDDSDFWYWAQTGYVKIQNPNEATVKRYVFAELKVPEALPNDWQTDVHPDPNQPTLNDFHQYQCKKLVGTDGNWYYHYDDEQNSWKMLNHAAWMNHTGKRAKWGAEITNKEDGMVGVKNGNECVFKEIKAASQYNAFFAPNITPGDLKSDDINEWKIKKRVSPGNDEIEIWDETP